MNLKVGEILLRQCDDDFDFPYISFDSICDSFALEGIDVCACPDDPDQLFRWYDIFNDDLSNPHSIDTHSILHLRDSASCLDFLETNSNDYVLLVTKDSQPPNYYPLYQNRILHVSSPDGFNKVCAFIEHLFMELLIWENKLITITAKQKPLEDLLDIAVQKFRNFIFAVSTEGTLIACSKHALPPNGSFRTLIESRALPESLHHLISPVKWKKEMENEMDTVLDVEGFTCLRLPLVLNRSVFGFIVMVCAQRPNTPGLGGAFLRFSKYAESLARAHWSKSMAQKTPHFFFLSALLDGQIHDRTNLGIGFASLGIPPQPQYKLTVVSAEDCSRFPQGTIFYALSSLHKGCCFCLPYKDHYVSICYTKEDTIALSHRQTMEDLDKHLYRPFGITAGISHPFKDILDANSAYEEAVFALSNKALLSSKSSIFEENFPKAAVTLEMACAYLPMMSIDAQNRLSDFVFKNSILNELVQEDLSIGTHNFAILWRYLTHDRSYAAVARQFYMHRNTVQYHIRQIEKKFDIDLSQFHIREGIAFEYRLMFDRLTSVTLQRLFDVQASKSTIDHKK